MQVTITGTTLGNQLQGLLVANNITPGDGPSYQLCKTLYEYHVLGAKMVDAPLNLMQSQKRAISVPKGPEDLLKEEFEKEWGRIGADDAIFRCGQLSRMYGAAAVGLLAKDLPADQPADYDKLWNQTIAFNVWDPLNIAGSIVLNQLPNAMDFLKTEGVSVNGTEYHRSRTVIKFNERPIYLGYTNSSFGYVGRSVYQRALYPLKSFVQTMVVDDMVSRKAGLLVLKLKAAGAIIDQFMQKLFAQKREVLKDAETNNVMSLGHEDAAETLNMQNIDGAYGMARGNILKNIATAADMPASFLENETMVEGFGEGTEDAKAIAQYINRMRIDYIPLYSFFDQVVQFRAWNPEFYKTVQAQFPDEYGDVDYKTALYEWRNSFKAEWPSLLTEPDSEKIKVDDVKLKSLIAFVQVLLPLPEIDPANKAIILQWAADNLNELPLLFSSPLELDYEAIAAYKPPAMPMPGEEGTEPSTPPPFSGHDSDTAGILRGLLSRIERAGVTRIAA